MSQKRKAEAGPDGRHSSSAGASASSSYIVIGIDFGTTYSGVSWARDARPDVLNMISNWQGPTYAKCHDKQQVPTTISYNSWGRPSAWGYSVPPSQEPLKWFKLLLLDNEHLPDHFRHAPKLVEAQAQMKELNKGPVDVIADYLRLLWTHSLEQISKSVTPFALARLKFKVVVTMPAIWPLYARLRMRDAVKKAGILDPRAAGETLLSFISEPEAAALAALTDVDGQAIVDEQSDFVVCDAGGGTVDLITYKMIKNDPMMVEECVKGDGNLCGAAVLDASFEEIFRSSLPENAYDRLNVNALARMWQIDWEDGIKGGFCGLEDDAYNIPMPSGSGIEGIPNSVDITPNSLLDIYEPVAASCGELINKQMLEVKRVHKRKPKFVVLVGGLGSSRFLYRYLSRELGDTLIIQARGDRPWTAVARGAAMQGLSAVGAPQVISVRSRIARASYGTTVNIIPWDASEHDSRDKLWCPIQQNFLAVSQTQWFLRIGEPISDKPCRASFWQDFTEPDNEIKTELVYSEAEVPPSRCDDTVKQLCEIKWENIPKFNTLPIWTNCEGEDLRQLVYEVQMASDGVSLDFAILYRGQRVASKNVSVDFEKVSRPLE
ncbi:unnamed protein product [Clonostachys rosea]|uniref:Actin-like ATPase domain-containing protein n=1 Tax=Bionectria ochroleuca TaxID=29856 RepID=A0ABY6U7P4_BIOOC|nr:unnamed protein product [Clonostachys rosea]